ncbi:hypothetical protein MTsPCn5_40480 [Croceitalea sp. MTPC5]|uniref:serine hydrolase domain-containing protein n=1 Tax=Croceitalea sp. MTPC5 TaxID=3056565 RepID=UPI002B3791F6|nr:hypothetical protein MTsPCn5_40480 [Croceitalea sp. MTPC5]
MIRKSSFTLLLLLLFSFSARAQLIAEDEEFIAEYIIQNKIPGLSIAIVKNSELVYSKGFGVKNSTTKEKVTNKTIFQAASLSKSLTGALILKNVEQQKIDLDTPVNTYLKDWKLESKNKGSIYEPTVYQLLTHTGGTNIHGFRGYKSTKTPPELLSILNGEVFLEPKIVVKNKPNTEFDYSGGGYVVLQKALIDINNKGFTEQMNEEILQPCGMISSFYSVNLNESQLSQIAIGHKKNGAPLESDYFQYPQYAAGGLWSTPTELTKFLIAVQKSINSDNTENLLSKESAKRLLERPILENGEKPTYGLGFGFKIDSTTNEIISLRHSGANVGYSCFMEASRDGKYAYIIMSNRDFAKLSGIRQRILNRIKNN